MAERRWLAKVLLASTSVAAAAAAAAVATLPATAAAQEGWPQDVRATGLSCISCHSGNDGGPLTELGRRYRWSGTLLGMEHHAGARSQEESQSESEPEPDPDPGMDLGDWSGEATWYGRTGRTRVLGSSQRQYTSTESLRIDGTHLFGRDDLAFHGEGLTRSSFSNGPESFDDDAARLVTAEIEWLGDKPGSWFRLGRQFVTSGVTVRRLDGAALRQPLGETFELDAFGGVPSDRGFGGSSGDLLVGGRFGARLGTKTRVGVSGFYAKDAADPSDLKAGVDLDSAPFEQLQLSGHLFYDWISDRLYDARLHAVYLPSIEWQIAADYSRTVPGLFLPKDSLFSIFSVDDYEETGLAVTRRLDPQRSIRAFARYTAYDDGTDLLQVGGGYDLRYGPNGEDSVGCELAYQDEERSSLGGSSADGDALFLRAYHFLWWTSQLYTSADVSIQAYAGEPLERDAILTELAVGLRPSDRLDLLVGVDHVRDAEFEQRLDLFARVTFRF